jgi:hypothetical protein
MQILNEMVFSNTTSTRKNVERDCGIKRSFTEEYSSLIKVSPLNFFSDCTRKLSDDYVRLTTNLLPCHLSLRHTRDPLSSGGNAFAKEFYYEKMES